MTDHLVVKNMISNSKLLSSTVVQISNKIIKRAEKKNLQTQTEAAKTPQQEKTSMMQMQNYVYGWISKQ